MICEIIHDEAALAAPSVPATAADAQVALDLIETLESLEDAAMLAANQIGSDKAVIAYKAANGRVHALFNPSIRLSMRPYQTAEECLSLERETPVTRYQTITVDYEELRDGELAPCSRRFTDFMAQLIQHGIDHCNGVVI